jgi:hypothetical protein
VLILFFIFLPISHAFIYQKEYFDLYNTTTPTGTLFKLETNYNITSINWQLTFSCNCFGTNRGSLYRKCDTTTWTLFNPNNCGGGDINLTPGCYYFGVSCGSPVSGNSYYNFNQNCYDTTSTNRTDIGFCDENIKITPILYGNVLAVSTAQVNVISNNEANFPVNYTQTRFTYCEKNLLPNPSFYFNQTLDCPMTLYLGDCNEVRNVKGTVKLFSTSLLQNNTGVGCGVIYDARGHEPINYNFEITGVKNAEDLTNWINACPDTTYNFIQQNLTPYQNLNSSINPGLTTARAYFIYNNTNYTIGKFYSTFQADCIIKLEANSTRCTKWCDFSTGTLNFNGTLTINGCTNPEYSIPCPTGVCGTWDSCMEAITNTTTDVNIIIQSSTMVSGILSFIFSGSGIWFFVMLVSNILLSQFVDEKILLFINTAFIFVAILLGWWSIFTITAILFALVIVFIKRD